MRSILEETFYNLAEIVQKIKVKPHVVKGYIQSNKLKGQRIGRSLYISAQSLQEFLKPDASVDPDPELTVRVRSFLTSIKRRMLSLGNHLTAIHLTHYRSGKRGQLCRRE